MVQKTSIQILCDFVKENVGKPSSVSQIAKGNENKDSTIRTYISVLAKHDPTAVTKAAELLNGKAVQTFTFNRRIKPYECRPSGRAKQKKSTITAQTPAVVHFDYSYSRKILLNQDITIDWLKGISLRLDGIFGLMQQPRSAKFSTPVEVMDEMHNTWDQFCREIKEKLTPIAPEYQTEVSP